MRKVIVVFSLSSLTSFIALTECVAFTPNDSARNCRNRRFHIEAFWAIAKFRPQTANLPQQLNTNINANLFLGWKLYCRLRKDHEQRVSVGGFAGIGTTKLSPSTTDHRTAEEYNAGISTYGAAILIGSNRFSWGLAVGMDYLMDSNRTIWIYQQKSWYGLTIGIKLNQ